MISEHQFLPWVFTLNAGLSMFEISDANPAVSVMGPCGGVVQARPLSLPESKCCRPLCFFARCRLQSCGPVRTPPIACLGLPDPALSAKDPCQIRPGQLGTRAVRFLPTLIPGVERQPCLPVNLAPVIRVQAPTLRDAPVPPGRPSFPDCPYCENKNLNLGFSTINFPPL